MVRSRHSSGSENPASAPRRLAKNQAALGILGVRVREIAQKAENKRDPISICRDS